VCVCVCVCVCTPVNGQWDTWGQWGSCRVSCGRGNQTSKRSCL